VTEAQRSFDPSILERQVTSISGRSSDLVLRQGQVFEGLEWRRGLSNGTLPGHGSHPQHQHDDPITPKALMIISIRDSFRYMTTSTPRTRGTTPGARWAVQPDKSKQCALACRVTLP
jgi:hypothetical protein